jgi:2-dehydropantoate 2-reductase
MTALAMKTAIIGPGAMGCLFAAYLKHGGLDVTLVDHRRERVERLRKNWIRVRGVRGNLHVQVPVITDVWETGPAELVFVCVKAHQTRIALEQHRSLVGEQTVIWSVQNGVGILGAMGQAVPEERIVGGSTTMGANTLQAGSIHHAGEGDTFIGEPSGGTSRRTERIADTLTLSGIPVKVHKNIHRVIWEKVLVSVGINALTAILKVRNGELTEHVDALGLMEAAVREGIQVAASQGYSFDEADVQSRVREVALRTARNRSSMLQDMLAGRRTEIDFINGAIARMGTAPVNETLTRLVRALEAKTMRREKSID